MMKTNNRVIMTRGLPGSGKTSWAKQHQAEHPGMLRVNKDELRATLHDSVHSKANENFVLAVRDFIVGQALAEGHDIIVDDTNFGSKHLPRLQEIADKHRAVVGIQDFTDVPIETCIQRDLKRSRSVGERVIRQMHRQFLEAKPVKPVYDEALPDCIICDLDGTLALFDRDKVNAYDRDFLADEINKAVNDLLWARWWDRPDALDIFIFSGRKDTFKEQTLQWLRSNDVCYDRLCMRKADDSRPDTVVKEEMYNEYIAGRRNVIAVIDDRLSVCRLWHRLGLPLFRVGDPDADF